MEIAGVGMPVHACAQQANAFGGQFELFDALTEANLYHDVSRSGFFSILSKVNDKSRQDNFRLSEMPHVLPLLPKNKDTWMSQCEFFRPNRRIVNLLRIPLLFVDIDSYSLSSNQALSALLWHCDDFGLPHPSITVFSGRGLQVKWFLDRPLPRLALPRWNLIQTELVRIFGSIGADKNSKDASRVLRLVNTTNTKSGETVKVIHTTPDETGQPIHYGFEYLAEILLPNSRNLYDKKLNNHPYSEHEKQTILKARLAREQMNISTQDKSAIKSKQYNFSGKQLSWNRFEDIRKLVEMRGCVHAGQGMQTLFLAINFLLLSEVTNSREIYFEAAAICREFGLGEFFRSSELSTLYAKAREHEAGKTVFFNGREYPQLYTPKNETLINLLSITDAEQRQLKTIISEDISKEREREIRRLKRHEIGENKLSRKAYVSANDENRSKAIKMRAEGKSIRKIADLLKVSLGSVHRWTK